MLHRRTQRSDVVGGLSEDVELPRAEPDAHLAGRGARHAQLLCTWRFVTALVPQPPPPRGRHTGRLPSLGPSRGPLHPAPRLVKRARKTPKRTPLSQARKTRIAGRVGFVRFPDLRHGHRPGGPAESRFIFPSYETREVQLRFRPLNM
ncbi:hypothetical protein PAL_GLEAN10009366 [Pteropus alecto]|uniref:Uncharacterized protein n=1 Tax=Pteropus alecto TaxID=9402 RepID=L5KVF8_PTEAL|nr:hypothetical protein PAL_GLEAN10009366 [Pteropus alecto]